jgi:hypothetical protein
MMSSEAGAMSVVAAGAAVSPLACAQLGDTIDLSSRRVSPALVG